MNLHANAALSLNGRRQLCRRVVDEQWTVTKAAEVSVHCARKWVGRYRTEGELGLLDRSSAPSVIPHRTGEERVQTIAALRRLRFTGPETAETLGMALSTVSGVLTRIGMGKLGRLGRGPVQRYERDPGERHDPHQDARHERAVRRGTGPGAQSM
jgi:leucine-zipper of insertion element IS481